MRLAIVARMRDRNPMEVDDDLGRRFGDYFRMADDPTRNVTGYQNAVLANQRRKHPWAAVGITHFLL